MRNNLIFYNVKEEREKEPITVVKSFILSDLHIDQNIEI